MTRDDRELLAELARVNSDVVPVATHVMDDSATSEEQREPAERLIRIGQRLRRRADHTGRVIEGQAVAGATSDTHSTGPTQET